MTRSPPRRRARVIPPGTALEPLSQWPAGTVAALDRPHPVRPDCDVPPHRGVAGLVSGEPTRAEQLLVVVNDLDGRRQFVGINPDGHARHDAFLALDCRSNGEVGSATASRAVPSLATPRHGARRAADRKRATPRPQVGSRVESHPPDTWSESGQTPDLPESSSSPRKHPRHSATSRRPSIALSCR
jgi:hypothetical protein